MRAAIVAIMAGALWAPPTHTQTPRMYLNSLRVQFEDGFEGFPVP